MTCAHCGAEMPLEGQACPRCGLGAAAPAKSRNQKIGLIVVIAILAAGIMVVVMGIVAAIAIPSFIRSKRETQTRSAMATLRLIGSAEVAYSCQAGNDLSYGRLADLTAQGFLDGRFKTGTAEIDGYRFTCEEVDRTTFKVAATPIEFSEPSFYVNESVIVYYGNGTPAY